MVLTCEVTYSTVEYLQVFMMVEYRGSRLLHPFASVIGLPVDQLNFVVCQLVALAFSFFFFKRFSPQKCSASARHAFALVLGTGMDFQTCLILYYV